MPLMAFLDFVKYVFYDVIDVAPTLMQRFDIFDVLLFRDLKATRLRSFLASIIIYM